MLEEKYLAPAPPSKGKIVALDCHPDVFTAAVVQGTSPAKMIHEQTRGDMDLCTLLEWLKANFSAADIVLLEASANSFGLHKHFTQLGLRCCVLESAWVGKQACNYADSDKIAAVRIARVYLQGNCPAVWVPDQLTSERRELLHLYTVSVTETTRATNALKAYLNQHTVRATERNLSLPKNHDWLFGQRQWTPMQRVVLEEHLAQLVHATARRKRITKEICSQVAACPQMLALMSLLGIAKINAFALVASIGEVSRFASPRKLAAYLGLCPGQRTSGKGKIIRVGIGNRGRKDMRNLLVQAAHAVLRQGSRSKLGKWGMGLFLRKGNRNVAVAAIARKLSAQVWHLLMGHAPQVLKKTASRSKKYRELLTTIGKEHRAIIQLPPTLELCIEYLDGLVETLIKQQSPQNKS